MLGEYVDAGVILGVVLINAIVGHLQAAKAERAIGALSRMLRTESTVRRQGQKQRVHSAELVPGDIVLLQSGDRVPHRRDGRPHDPADPQDPAGQRNPGAGDPGPRRGDLPHRMAPREFCQ
ncbi:MAG: hypothetical protein FJ379_05245 [Verrucomicrobia bacterium]|nr:hypothetical protein [Verrucomicrobiota bacterium]